MRLVLTVIRFLDQLSRPLIVAAAFVGLAVIGLLDHLAGYRAVVGFFYLVPIALAAWYAGLRWGAFFSAAGAIVGTLVGAPAAAARGTPPPGWDVVLQVVVFLFFALLLAALRAAHDHETALARTDALTGAANQRRFYEQLDREIRRCRRYRRPFTLIYGDLDNFKAVNDRLGHAAGDALLQDVAESMQRAVRNTDIVARLGGDEFAVLLPETGPEAGQLVAQQLRHGVLGAMQRCACPIGGSFGVVTCVDPPASAEALLALADELMYAAKREGKSGVRHAVVVANRAAGQVRPTAPPAKGASA